MKVILTHEVKDLGHHDDVINVSEGYARNFLFPRKLAIPATPGNLADVNKRRRALEAKEEKIAEEAKATAQQLTDVQVTLKGRVGGGTKLYGSITHADIADALEQQHGIKIDKRKIVLDESIKSLGTYEVPIRLHREALAHVKVEVVGE